MSPDTARLVYEISDRYPDMAPELVRAMADAGYGPDSREVAVVYRCGLRFAFKQQLDAL